MMDRCRSLFLCAGVNSGSVAARSASGGDTLALRAAFTRERESHRAGGIHPGSLGVSPSLGPKLL